MYQEMNYKEAYENEKESVRADDCLDAPCLFAFLTRDRTVNVG